MPSDYSSRGLLGLVIVIAVLIGVGYWWVSRDHDADIAEPEPAPDQAPAVAEDTGGSEAAPEPETPEAQREEIERRVEEFVRSRNKDFDFAGRIVDQNGAPVPGVVVDALIRVAAVDVTFAQGNKREEITAITDSSGNFRLKGNGMSMMLAFQKPGYGFDRIDNINLLRMSEEKLGQLGRDDKPTVFQAWRMSSQPSDDVSTGRVYRKIVADGTFQAADIERTGDLVQISMTRAADGSFDRPSSWSAGLRIKNGEIQETSSTQMYEAPSEEYVPQWSVSYDKDRADWKKKETHRFFFRSDGGRTHGALTIEFRPYYNTREESSAAIEYRLNPTGSRNLYSTEDG